MKKRKQKQPHVNYISLDEAIHTLRVSPDQMDEWIRLGVIKAYKSPAGIVLRESDFKTLAHSSIALNAALYALGYESRRRANDNQSGLTGRFRHSTNALLATMKRQTDSLEAIHRKYHDKVDVLRDQTGVTAAYIIFSKVFRLFRMAFLCVENSFWDTLILIRPINEALDLATYFVISKDTTDGSRHIREWFRENKSPSHSICRTAIEKYATTLLPNNLDTLFQGLMGKLYHATSKPIHIAHHNIMEIYVTEMNNGELKRVGFDYGPCTYPRKIHGVAGYLRSVLLAAVNSFTLCFQIAHPLIDSVDANTLQELQRELLLPPTPDEKDEVESFAAATAHNTPHHDAPFVVRIIKEVAQWFLVRFGKRS